MISNAGHLVAGRYRLATVLGRGGMAQVWSAEDELLRRTVALKEIRIEGASYQEVRRTRRRVYCEARAAAGVDHTSVVRVYDLLDEGNRLWIVMELLTGQTLAETLKARGPLPVGEVARIGLRLLDALQAVHETGVVHQDVKPANVLLCDDHRVTLTDFGIATTAADLGEPSQSSGEFAGSPGYVSPEQVRGSKIGPASDLFSLGSTLFDAVEGQPPFATDSIFEMLTAVVHAAPGPFRRAGTLTPVIEGLLAKEPERRLTVDAARVALDAMTRHGGSSRPRYYARRLPVGEANRPRRTVGDRKQLAAY